MKRTENVTAAQIAERLSLSRTTVALVLSGRGKANRIAESTEERVLDAAKAMDYRPNAAARQLVGKRGNAVGVLVTSELMVDLRLIEAMEIIAAERGIRFIVGHAVGSTERVKDYLGDFRARGVDGLFSFFHHHPKHREAILPSLLSFDRVVYYERPIGLSARLASKVCYVAPDFHEVGRLGTQHLVDRGRRRIALVLREADIPYAIARREAYQAVLRHSGRKVDPDLIWVMTDRTGQHWLQPPTLDLASIVVEDLVVKAGADAIIAVNDLYAACLVSALHKRGIRVPDDVAVIGCDNLEFGQFIDPPLTTVDLRLADLAQALMRMMLNLLDGQAIPKESRAVLVRPELAVRESS
jgi:DNA-binding LacI/PurR family transcriptional regulator